jgi:hypothetical protein
MSLYYDLPVFKDVYALTLRLFQLTQNFSREYKFTLGQDMKRGAVNLVRICNEVPRAAFTAQTNAKTKCSTLKN